MRFRYDHRQQFRMQVSAGVPEGPAMRARPSPLTIASVALLRLRANYAMAISKDTSCPIACHGIVIPPRENARHYPAGARVTFVSFFDLRRNCCASGI